MSLDLLDYYNSIKKLLVVNGIVDSKIKSYLNKLNDNAGYFNNDIINELTSEPNLLDFINSQIIIKVNIINLKLLSGCVKGLDCDNKEVNLIIGDFLSLTSNLIKHQKTIYRLIECEIANLKHKLDDIDNDSPDE